VGLDPRPPEKGKRPQVPLGLGQRFGVEGLAFPEQKLPTDDDLFGLDVELIPQTIGPVVGSESIVLEDVFDQDLDAVDDGAGGVRRSGKGSNPKRAEREETERFHGGRSHSMGGRREWQARPMLLVY
jgi:hypothetical protein